MTWMTEVSDPGCKFHAYHYRRKNDIILTLFDGEVMSLDESEGNFIATSSITANFYCDDAKAANAFVRILVRPERTRMGGVYA